MWTEKLRRSLDSWVAFLKPMEFYLVFFGKFTFCKEVFDILTLVTLQLDDFSKILLSIHVSIAIEKLEKK